MSVISCVCYFLFYGCSYRGYINIVLLQLLQVYVSQPAVQTSPSERAAHVYTDRHVASGNRYCTNTVMCVALEHRSAVQVRSVYKSKERDTDRKISDRHVFVYALFSTNSA